MRLFLDCRGFLSGPRWPRVRRADLDAALIGLNRDAPLPFVFVALAPNGLVRQAPRVRLQMSELLSSSRALFGAALAVAVNNSNVASTSSSSRSVRGVLHA